MSLILDGKTIVGPGNSPYIGENGHWWCGHNDLGVDAGTDIHYITIEDFKVATEEGIYYVYDADHNEVACWHVDAAGRKWIVSDKDIIIPTVGPNGNWFIGDTDLGIPVSGTVSGGAAIDDMSINGTTVWSSTKTYRELQKLKEEGIPGKNLEYRWDHSKLGVRQEGQTEYSFSELMGPMGPAGIDGSAVLGARLEGNDLILIVQDTENPIEDSKLLDLEKGFINAKDMKDLVNEITRINTEISNLKHSSFREYVSYMTDTDGEFDSIITLKGCGYAQILCTPFVGSVRITVDGITYMKKISQAMYHMMGETSLVALDQGNQLAVQPMFAEDFTAALDIRFNQYLTCELMVEAGSAYPKFVFQGSNYRNTIHSGSSLPSAPGGDGIVHTMTIQDVDIMMGLAADNKYVVYSTTQSDFIVPTNTTTMDKKLGLE